MSSSKISQNPGILSLEIELGTSIPSIAGNRTGHLRRFVVADLIIKNNISFIAIFYQWSIPRTIYSTKHSLPFKGFYKRNFAINL
uniref:KilA-N domain-containing protein n=1 Tax=Ascaris lumbricoides TaxID=6252 RepID=A0A0M3IV44_ASCLU